MTRRTVTRAKSQNQLPRENGSRCCFAVGNKTNRADARQATPKLISPCPLTTPLFDLGCSVVTPVFRRERTDGARGGSQIFFLQITDDHFSSYRKAARHNPRPLHAPSKPPPGTTSHQPPIRQFHRTPLPSTSRHTITFRHLHVPQHWDQLSGTLQPHTTDPLLLRVLSLLCA